MQELTWLFILFTLNTFFIFPASAINNSCKNHNHELPCPKPNVACLRHLLGDQLKCDKHNENPYRLNNLHVNIPVANTSFLWKNTVVAGFRDYKINEFHINKITKTLVFEVQFNTLIIDTPKSYYFFHVKGRETVVTSDYFEVIYRDLSLTFIVPYDGAYRPSKSILFSYVTDGNPDYRVGPKLTPKGDPEALKCNNEVYKDIPVTLREVFTAHGPKFFDMFLQIVVCDNYTRNL